MISLRTYALCVLIGLAASVARAQSALMFSPNGDGVKDQVTFKFSLPANASISSWRFDIHELSGKDQLGARVKTFADKGQPPLELKWDGKDLSNRLVKDGTYLFTLNVVTPAGNQQAITPSPLIVDRVAPATQIAVEPSLFSPNGDGVKDEASFRLNASDANGIYSWLLVIKDAEGASLRTFRGKETPPSVISWDGRGDFEETIPDGAYAFEMIVDDRAGNRTSAPAQKISINRAGLISTLEAVPNIFSPNGDGVKDQVVFRIVSGAPESVVRWTLKILNANGKIVHAFSGSNDPPQRIVWNGLADNKKTVPDGAYQVIFSETDLAGNTSVTAPHPLEVDTTPPLVEIRLEPTLLSPNGDNVNDLGLFYVTAEDVHPMEHWAIKIFNDVGKPVKTLSGQTGSKPLPTISWNGDSESGQTLIDGVYSYMLEALDLAGNRSTTAKRSVRIDRVPPSLSVAADPALFSPNGDGILDFTTFTMSVLDAGPLESWSLEIIDAKNKIVRAFTGPANAAPARIVWDGKSTESLSLPDGPYSYILKARDIAGNTAVTAEQKVILGAMKPIPEIKADLRTISPNADNYKDMATFTLKAPAFNAIRDWTFRVLDAQKIPQRTMQGRGDPPGSLQWQGDRDDRRPLPDDDYIYELEVVDVAGNKATTLPQSIRIDTSKPQLSISAVPSLFSPNADGIKDETLFVANYKDASPLAKWKLLIQDPRKITVSVFSNEISAISALSSTMSAPGLNDPPSGALPASIPWKGISSDSAALPDGPYTYVFFAEDEVGNKTTTAEQLLHIDVSPPQVSITADPVLFSPNGDGVKDETTFQIDYKDASDIAHWKLVVGLSTDSVSRNFSGIGQPPRSLSWDGKNERGQSTPDGRYEAALWVTDEVGNTGKSVPVSLTLDTSKPLISVTADSGELAEIAPDMAVAENKEKDIVILLPNEVLFDTGQDSLKDPALPALRKVDQMLRRYPKRQIRIEGHADNVPIHNEKFKNNLDLTKARAKAVMQHFIEIGKIDIARIATEGYGDTRPHSSNAGIEGRRQNRRVEIILLKEKQSP